MIRNDVELKCTQERIAYFTNLVARLRISVPPANFPAMSGGYLTEIERMHAEVLAYLRRHAAEMPVAEAA